VNRFALLLAGLGLAVLACSLGGSESLEQESPDVESSDSGVAISKATPTPPQEVIASPTTEAAPTAVPEPTQVSIQPAISVAPQNEDIPIQILDYSFQPSEGLPKVYGLFQHIGEYEISSPEITLFFHDENGDVIGAASGFADFQKTAPGEITPFHISFFEGVPEGAASASFAANWNPAYQNDEIRREGFEIEILQEEQGSFAYEIDVKVTNNNERNTRGLFFATLFYNADERLVGYDFSGVDDLEAGSSAFHKISAPLEWFAEPEFDRYEIMMEGYLPSP